MLSNQFSTWLYHFFKVLNKNYCFVCNALNYSLKYYYHVCYKKRKVALLSLKTNKEVENDAISSFCIFPRVDEKMAASHLVPNTFSPRTFGPPQLVPKNKQSRLIWSPRQLVPLDNWSPNIWSPWTNGPPKNWSPWTIGPQNFLILGGQL